MTSVSTGSAQSPGAHCTCFAMREKGWGPQSTSGAGTHAVWYVVRLGSRGLVCFFSCFVSFSEETIRTYRGGDGMSKGEAGLHGAPERMRHV